VIGGPCEALSPGALKACGMCPSSRVAGEGVELDTVKRHLAGDALALDHGVHLEYGPPLPPLAALRSSSPRLARWAA
jgi:hypothetical protein